MVSEPDGFDVSRRGAGLQIRLTRPEHLNAVTSDALNDLADLLEEVAADRTVRVIRLTGEGRAFCSGADLGDDDEDDQPLSESRWTATLAAANRVIAALRVAPQPVIAAVNGPAAGFGCSLALACDLIIAAESAYFLLAFTDIALMPDGGATALLPASLGRSRALHLALLAERVPARTALDWGMVYRVVPGDQLDAECDDLADRIATRAPQALARTKEAINSATLSLLDTALDLETKGQMDLLTRTEFKEALAAFQERGVHRSTDGGPARAD